MSRNVKNIIEVIDYIESHLHEKLDLEKISQAAHYSKYHLHRMFTGAVGLSIHDYVKRRQLTEAAKLLVFSDRSILEIALTAGYESQQSLLIFLKLCIKNLPINTGRKKNFIPCS